MSESALRVERLELRPSSFSSYLWRPPAKQVAVRLALEVIERLEKDALETFRSVTARGSEIGGLLLGHVVMGQQLEIVVEGYEAVACDYSNGPLYRPSEADRQRLDLAMQARGGGSGPAVVGFYRSHTRKGLSLDAEDMAFLEPRFNDPTQIFLLIRPFATKASVAGIFLCEDGGIHGEASPLEFPFSAAELGKQQEDSEVSSKPAVRAQVVPIAPKREPVAEPEPPAAPAAAPESVRAPEPQPPAAVAPPAKSAPEPPKAPAAAAAKAEPPKAPAPAAAKAEPPKAPAPPAAKAEPPKAPAPAAVAPAAPAPSFGTSKPEPSSEKEKKSGGKLLWIGGAAAALAAAGFFIYPLLSGGRKAAPPPAPPAALALRAERTGGDLLVMWNRNAESVQTAARAVLTISDGPQQENLTMDLAQLRNGSIVYTPATADVSFRLEVTSSDPARSQNELLRVLKPVVDAAQAAKKADQAKTPPPAQPPAAATPAPEPAVKRASRPFNAPAPESPLARLRATRPSDMPEPPPEPGSGTQANLAPPSVPGAPVSAPSPLPAPPPPTAAAAAKPAAPTTRVGGMVKPAELISRREPVYPPLARQSRVDGIVAMDVRIGADGRVKDVKALQGHPMLRAAAVDAVRMWVYRPATLNGEAVESNSRVEVRFVGGR